MKTLLFMLLLAGKAAWGTDVLEQFRAEALKQEKPIAVYFSGSDWCTNCHQFRRMVLEQDTVKQLLEQGYIYYTADFPQRARLSEAVVQLNEALAEKLNPEGAFPVLIITDNDWNIKARIYKGNTLSTIVDKLKANRSPEP